MQRRTHRIHHLIVFPLELPRSGESLQIKAYNVNLLELPYKPVIRNFFGNIGKILMENRILRPLSNKKSSVCLISWISIGLAFSGIGLASAQDAPSVAPDPAGYSPYPEQSFPNQVFFGDTHLHTTYSWDAGMVFNTLTPADAYRFAKGETVVSSTGVPARLQRPLDWLVVSDHSDGLGIAPLLARADPALLEDPLGAELHAFTSLNSIEGAQGAYNLWLGRTYDGTNHLAKDPNVPKVPWEEIIDAAETANTPGSFTAFIGYEWSSAPGGNNLHRVVVYRDGKEQANTISRQVQERTCLVFSLHHKELNHGH